MASINKEYLLTIAIPTYNRAKFLDRALHSIGSQLKNKNLHVELIVSDNCSTDSTEEVVSTHINKGLTIRYVKNIENKGADFNIVQCYLEARGKYVVAFGDDDIFIDGSIDQIIKILEEDEYGVVYLRSTVFKENLVLNSIKPNYDVFVDSTDFIKKVNYFTTFISANIVNTKYLKQELLDRYMGTSLVQLGFILEAILIAKKNVFVSDLFIAAEPDNTGGYNLFEVFGPRYYTILNDFEKMHNNTAFKDIIVKELLISFFPNWLMKLKNGDVNFDKSRSITGSLKSIYKGYSLFWLILVPLDNLPKPLANCYFFLIRCLLKMRRMILG